MTRFSAEERAPCLGQEQHGEDREVRRAFDKREKAELSLELEENGGEGKHGKAQRGSVGEDASAPKASPS